MDFFIWTSDYVDGLCVVEPPEIEDEWELDDAVPRLANFPSDVQCKFDPEFPDDIELSDNLFGAGRPVVSAKIRNLLESLVTNNRVEYLPIKVINHKGRIAAEDYFVLHPLDLQDCIDLEASGIVWNQISTKQITSCSGLVLKHDERLNESQIFRPKFWGSEIMVCQDIVDRLSQECSQACILSPRTDTRECFKGVTREVL